MNATNLVAWLPFDTSTTQDLCGNTWTAYGSPTIANGALQLNGSSYLQMTGGITLGGQDFTIRGKFLMNSDSGAYCRIFSFHNSPQTTANCINIARQGSSASLYTDCMGSSSSAVAISLNQPHDFEFNYYHETSTVKIFFDGVLSITLSKSISRTNFPNCFINKSNYPTDGYLVGSIDEFQIYDGVALHTENFTPPTADDYIALTLDLCGEAQANLFADVELKINNDLLKFEYYGTDGISTGLTLLSDLPAEQSRDGSGFYRTERNKCFNVPACYEVIIDFDVWFNGSQRWRAYNGGSNGDTGIASQTNGTLSYFKHGGEYQKDFANICKVNQLQHVRLHMISDDTDGVIEAWIDGSLLYTYSGDVNHGQPFNDLYLQSDGSGTFFSSFYISNVVPDWFIVMSNADLICDVHNQEYANQIITRDGLTTWLPFIFYPEEDLCGGYWGLTDSDTRIVLSPNGVNNECSLYFSGDFETSRGRFFLNCQGMYLGGKDFTVSFDWWYGGARTYITHYPFSVWNDDYSSGIGIACRERYTPNWQRLQLQAFGQSTALTDFDYQQWHAVKLEYKHADGKLTLYLDETSIGELDITIPRTFFPHVEIDRGEVQYHGSGYLSDFKITGGELAPDCPGLPIYLALLHNGQRQLYPFRAYDYGKLAVALYHAGRVWYNVLRELDDDWASDYHVEFDGTTYALTGTAFVLVEE